MPIAKIVKGNTAQGCLSYVLDKPEAVLHQTNCVGQRAREIAQEFDLALQAQAQRQSRGRKAKTSVYHTSIAFDLEAQLSREQKLEIADRYLEGMGFDKGQNAYVIAEHHDTQHQHLHIIASRIRWDGYTTPCWQDYQRAEAIMRQVEADYGLKPVSSSREAEVKAPTVAEVRRSRSTGKPIPRVVIQQAIDDCLERVRLRSLEQLQEALQQQDITLTTRPVETRSGGKTLALLFELEGRTYSASKLGKKYRYSRLAASFEAALMEQEMELTTGAAPTGAGSNAGIWVESERRGKVNRGVGNEQLVSKVVPETTAEPDYSAWQDWLEGQTNEHPHPLEGEVSEQARQDWMLWTAYSKGADEWLRSKGLAPVPDMNGQRRLAQVALYCRLKNDDPKQVARALLASPCKVSSLDRQIAALPWEEQAKQQFAVLKLMMRVDQQVRQMQNRMERSGSGQQER